MRLHLAVLAVLPLLKSSIVIDDPPKKGKEIIFDPKYYKDGKMDIPMSYEAGKELYEHWTEQAFGGLMAAIATKKLTTLSKKSGDLHEICTNRAKNMQSHAKCLVKLMQQKSKKKRRKNTSTITTTTTTTTTTPAPTTTTTTTTAPKILKYFHMKSSERLYKTSAERRVRPKSLERRYKSSERKPKNSMKHIKKKTKSSEKKYRYKSSEKKSLLKKSKKWVKKYRSSELGHRGLKPKKLKYTGTVHKDEWMGAFRRVKREIVSRSSYNLIGQNDRPFGRLARQLRKSVRVLSGKDGSGKKWKTLVEETRKEMEMEKKRKKEERSLRDRMEIMTNVARKYAGRSEKLFSDYKNNRIQTKPNRPLAMPELDALESKVEDEEEKEMLQEAKEIMRNNPQKRKEMEHIQLLRDAMKLGLSLAGQNTTDFDKKNIRMISPRFFPLNTDEEVSKKEIDLLSPSLFSLQEKGSPLDKGLSIPNLVKTVGGLSGVSQTDEEDMIDFIMEAAGIEDALMKNKLAKEGQLKIQPRDIIHAKGIEGQPLYMTKKNVTDHYGEFEGKKIEAFETLQKMLTPKQIAAMNDTGYAVMTKEQKHFLYGPSSPFNNSVHLEGTKNTSEAEVHAAIHGAVRNIADGKARFEVRQKDVILSPISFTAFVNNPQAASQALVLSPLLFCPVIQSPSVFGSVILSPWVFVPLVLAPRVLAPVVLSPFLFAPIILTPVALTPVILSPGVFNPFVLSPLVLCPFILSPQVFTPVILTPFALTPFIGTPTVGSPLILSPFVLSPSVFSPGFFTAVILSPYAFSPAFNSTGAAITVFGSPSFMS